MSFFRTLFVVCLLAAAHGSLAQVRDSIKRPRDITRDEFNMNDSLNTPPRETNRGTRASQRDTLLKDSARLALESLPGRAARHSLFIPGWGQITNKKYAAVKVPIIYAGFVGLGYYIWFNNRYYQETLEEVQLRLENQGLPQNPAYERYRTDQLINAKDYWRRNRDLLILVTAGWYALQAVEAYVTAYFFRYDISSDLTFNIKPSLLPPANAYAFNQLPMLGLRATLTIK